MQRKLSCRHQIEIIKYLWILFELHFKMNYDKMAKVLKRSIELIILLNHWLIIFTLLFFFTSVVPSLCSLLHHGVLKRDLNRNQTLLEPLLPVDFWTIPSDTNGRTRSIKKNIPSNETEKLYRRLAALLLAHNEKMPGSLWCCCLSSFPPKGQFYWPCNVPPARLLLS